MRNGCTSWPDEAIDRYTAAGYWSEATFATLGRETAARDPGRVAVASAGLRLTYGQLDRDVSQVAAGLRSLGLCAGDCVVVQLGNQPEFVVASLALFRIGAVPVYALPAHRRVEVQYLSRTANAVAYIAPACDGGFDYRDLARELLGSGGVRHAILTGDAAELTSFDALWHGDLDSRAGAPAPVDPGEVAFFLLSGGTTGLPKLIPRTHRDYMYQLRESAAALRFDASSAYLAALPVAHNAALGCPGVLGALLAGGRVVLATSPSPDEAFPLIEAERVTHTTLMPPILSLWVELHDVFGTDLGGVVLQVGGAKLPPELATRAIETFGSPFTHWFGMAEGLLTYTRLNDPAEVVVHTAGRPLSPDDEIRIVDASGDDVAPGEIGELLTRGPYTLRGYYRADDHNARSFTSDGFLKTGDLCRRTSRGDLVIEGRIKDVINRGGEKVSAPEVEEHLLEHPAVRQVALVAIADRAMGEKTCAVVVSRGACPSLRELREFLKQRGLADYKLPDRVVERDTLPHTSVGKIDKRAIRATLEQADAA